VNFFFVISGFYMGMILNEKLEYRITRNFYISRLLRLFPIFIIGQLLALIVSFEEVKDLFFSLSGTGRVFFSATNLFIFGQDFSEFICFLQDSKTCASGPSLQLNPVTWSLSVELAFYAVAPFIVRSPIYIFRYIFVGLIYQSMVRFIELPFEKLGFLRELT
jgi:peptidoglycan/LPS O-acetylase OafA/YrhL